jgi:hypothetical protein
MTRECKREALKEARGGYETISALRFQMVSTPYYRPLVQRNGEATDNPIKQKYAKIRGFIASKFNEENA